MFVSFMPNIINMRADPSTHASSLLKHKSSFFFIVPMNLLINCGSSFNNCASLNIFSIKTSVFAGAVDYTLLFIYPHRKKSQGVRSCDLVSHSTSWFTAIIRVLKTSVTKLRTGVVL